MFKSKRHENKRFELILTKLSPEQKIELAYLASKYYVPMQMFVANLITDDDLKDIDKFISNEIKFYKDKIAFSHTMD